MHEEIDFDQILSQYRADPFEYIDVLTSHTGRLNFKAVEEDAVEGVTGEWQHINGTLLFQLERERNVKPVYSVINGVVSSVEHSLEGQFVEAGEKVMTIRHPLKKREIIERILRTVLSMFPAPERAKYFFALDIQSRIDKHGQRSIAINPGDEILTMSLMKRDTPILYHGEPGIIHSVYFSPGATMDQGQPLIGVCSEEKLPLIQKIIARVKSEWE
jgi:hypothetical protein